MGTIHVLKNKDCCLFQPLQLIPREQNYIKGGLVKKGHLTFQKNNGNGLLLPATRARGRAPGFGLQYSILSFKGHNRSTAW